jgi:hypothetical protein
MTMQPINKHPFTGLMTPWLPACLQMVQHEMNHVHAHTWLQVMCVALLMLYTGVLQQVIWARWVRSHCSLDWFEGQLLAMNFVLVCKRVHPGLQRPLCALDRQNQS